MKKLITIKNDNIDLTTMKPYTREAARGVILRGDHIYLVYSKHFNDYTIPGGGVEEGHTLNETLVKELNEETGAVGVEIVEEIGYIEEIEQTERSGFNAFHQKSYYFLCNVDDFKEQKLEDYEIEYGYESKWVSIDVAINHNKKIISQGNTSVAKRRAQFILEYVKEKYV